MSCFRSRDSDDSSSDTPRYRPPEALWTRQIHCAVEVDFLVAKEKPGVRYAPEPSRDRWACPHDAVNPVRECVRYCAEVVNNFGFPHNLIGVAMRDVSSSLVGSRSHDPHAFERLSGSGAWPNVLPEMKYWFFQPQPAATPRDGAPREYGWVGVRMRSPLRPLDQILPLGIPQGGGTVADHEQFYGVPRNLESRRFDEVRTMLGVLRAGVKMHVNSTCHMRITLHLKPDGFDLLTAKKMLTLCWILERDIFLPMQVKPPLNQQQQHQHQHQHQHRRQQQQQHHRRHHQGRYLPVTTSSNLARILTFFPSGNPQRLRGRDQRAILQLSVPQPRPAAEEMDSHIPDLHNPVLQERVNLLWCPDTLPDLAAAIASPATGSSSSSSSIALHTFDRRYQPLFEFRYGTWHPQLEDYQYWAQLFGRLFHVALAADDFAAQVARLDDTLHRYRNRSVERRWEETMEHVLDESTIRYWLSFRGQMREGGVLAPGALDRQGILEAIPGIDYNSSPETEGSSSS